MIKWFTVHRFIKNNYLFCILKARWFRITRACLAATFLLVGSTESFKESKGITQLGGLKQELIRKSLLTLRIQCPHDLGFTYSWCYTWNNPFIEENFRDLCCFKVLLDPTSDTIYSMSFGGNVQRPRILNFMC